MWIMKFKIYKKSNLMIAESSDVEYDTQQLAFAFIDEQGDKNEQYIILPVIRFDKDVKSF